MSGGGAGHGGGCGYVRSACVVCTGSFVGTKHVALEEERVGKRSASVYCSVLHRSQHRFTASPRQAVKPKLMKTFCFQGKWCLGNNTARCAAASRGERRRFNVASDKLKAGAAMIAPALASGA